MPKTSSKLFIIIAFIAVYIIWGSTYLLNKIAVTQLGPFFLASIRFSTSGILILGIAKLLKLKLTISKKELLNTIFVGFLFLVYGNCICVTALKYVDSGFAALIASTQPLFVLLLMRIIHNKKIHTKSIIGIALGIIGMFLLVYQQKTNSTNNSILGITMILSCVLVWSFASVYVKNAKLPKSYFVSSGYQMLFASIMQLFVSYVLNENWLKPIYWKINVIWSMLLLIVFGSIVAFTAFNYLLKEVSTEKVATSAFVNPIVALILGWYILDEKLNTQSIIASIILLTGVYFITSKKSKNIK